MYVYEATNLFDSVAVLVYAYIHVLSAHASCKNVNEYMYGTCVCIN